MTSEVNFKVKNARESFSDLTAPSSKTLCRAKPVFSTSVQINFFGVFLSVELTEKLLQNSVFDILCNICLHQFSELFAIFVNGINVKF